LHLVHAVHFGELDLDDMVGLGVGPQPDEIGLDRQLAPAAIDQHRQADRLRPAKIRQRVERRADRTTGIEHVVDQHEPRVGDVKVDLCATDDRIRPDRRQVVTVERDIEHAVVRRLHPRFLQQWQQALGECLTAAPNAHDRNRDVTGRGPRNRPGQLRQGVLNFTLIQ